MYTDYGELLLLTYSHARRRILWICGFTTASYIAFSYMLYIHFAVYIVVNRAKECTYVCIYSLPHQNNYILQWRLYCDFMASAFCFVSSLSSSTCTYFVNAHWIYSKRMLYQEYTGWYYAILLRVFLSNVQYCHRQSRDYPRQAAHNVNIHGYDQPQPWP